MQSNIVLKVLSGSIIALMVYLGVRIVTNGGQELQQADTGPAPGNNLGGINENIVQHLGVEGDNIEATLNTIVARMYEYEGQLTETLKENKELRKELDNIQKMEGSIEERVLSRVNQGGTASTSNPGDSGGLLSDMTNRGRELKDTYLVNGGTFSPGRDVPPGIGIDVPPPEMPASNEIVWIDPLDAQKVADRTSADGFRLEFPDVVHDTFAGTKDTINLHTPGMFQPETTQQEPSLTPFFTIPANSTLIGSVSMSALLGRIPIDGTVVDPYPVKFLVGPENLATNGINIPPAVTGIVMSGVAKGDWNLSCVSADIYSMTFTFQDGTVRTLPEGTETGTQSTQPIAWISDKYGIPCVTGKRITNAPQYIGSRVGLGALDAYAQAMAQAETTSTINSSGGSNTVIDGNHGRFAANHMLSGGTREIMDWVDKRMQQSFDAIYVPPGVEVVIHPVEQLEIDYNPNGRKVNHYANQISTGIRRTLD